MTSSATAEIPTENVENMTFSTDETVSISKNQNPELDTEEDQFVYTEGE